MGLVESREYISKRGRWYCLTARGKRIRDTYAAKHPIWYTDLGNIPNAKSAILLLYIYSQIRGLSLSKKALTKKVRIGLVSSKLVSLARKIEGQLGLEFSRDYKRLVTKLDFCFDYDIPPESRDEVLTFLKILSKGIKVSSQKVMEHLAKTQIDELKSAFMKENKAMKVFITGGFAETTGISGGSVLRKVRKVVPSIGVLSQYRSSFEKEVAILLRLLNLNAVKYQGQVSDRCGKPHIVKFFETNPDILILNGLESLVECKSSGEWHSQLSSEKNVQKEFIIYQKYMPEVKTNSVLIVYEGSLDMNSRRLVRSLLEDANDLVLVTKNFLVDCVQELSRRKKLVQTIKYPRSYDALSRILMV